MTLQRWKLTIEYDGTPFSGWQRQQEAPSIQQHIEEAFFAFCQQELRLHVAGRTDAGVHAQGQVAHIDLDYGHRALSGIDLLKALNAHLRPLPISILKAEPVSENFHARYSATNKLYLYRILNRAAPPALDPLRVWHFKRLLDIEAMRSAAQNLIGTHDFTTFRDTECQAKSPIKTLDRLEVFSQGEEIHIEAEARSFLHHQVRNMVGTLLLVGERKWSCEEFILARDAKDRTKGGRTAPAQGLYLIRVDYEDPTC